MKNLGKFVSLSEAKTMSGSFSIDWLESFEGIKYHTENKIV